MQHAVASAPFPSTVLVVRIGRIVLLIPWILVWAIALAAAPVCWAIGFGTRGSARDPKHQLLRNWHVVVLLLLMMRGTTISLRKGQQHVYLKWV